MIQRKQSVYLLLAVIAYIVCLFLPIGGIEQKSMGGQVEVFNLGIVGADGKMSIVGTCVPLFILLSISAILAMVTIFMYRNRALQLNLCAITLLFNIIWYVDLALIFGFVTIPNIEASSFSIHFAACLPLVSLILVSMARKGIVDDEKLVKAADRIR